MPSWGHNLHKIYDADVNEFIEIARSSGPYAYEPDVTLPLDPTHAPRPQTSSMRPQTSMKPSTAATSKRNATGSRGGVSGAVVVRGKGGGKGVQNKIQVEEEENGKVRRYRRSASIAAPEHMYRRICTLRPAMQRNLKVSATHMHT